jgi:hypothetical protein
MEFFMGFLLIGVACLGQLFTNLSLLARVSTLEEMLKTKEEEEKQKVIATYPHRPLKGTPGTMEKY